MGSASSLAIRRNCLQSPWPEWKLSKALTVTTRSALLGWKLRKLVLTAGYALEPSRSGRRSMWASDLLDGIEADRA